MTSGDSPDTAGVPFGAALPRMVIPPPGPASLALADRLREVESRNVTHLADDWPVFWSEARGTNVRDADGNVYIDLTGAFAVSLLGHASPVALEAIEAQTKRMLHGMGDVHPPVAKVELLERLARIAPWPDSRAVLSSTGSEACETALKTASVATGRPGVIAFDGGYHGLTLGSLAVTERAHFRAPFAARTYGGVGFAPFPDARKGGLASGAFTPAEVAVSEARAADASIAVVRRLLRDGAPNGDPVGAVIVEPVQARGGARIPPAGYMAALSEVVHEAGALMIADEILTGLGRCGGVLASPSVGLDPDIICLGKGLGGGLPLSACVAPASVMDAWPESDGEAIHTSTFLGHPLACAVGSAVLQEIASADFGRRVEREGTRFLEALRRRVGSLPGVADVRGLGLLLGIEFTTGGSRAVGAGAKVAKAALRRGVIALPAGDDGHVLELTPPVGLTDAQMTHSVELLAEAIVEVM